MPDWDHPVRRSHRIPYPITIPLQHSPHPNTAPTGSPKWSTKVLLWWSDSLPDSIRKPGPDPNSANESTNESTNSRRYPHEEDPTS